MTDDAPTTSQWHRLGNVALAVAIVSSLAIGAVGQAAAQTDRNSPAGVVELEETGTAEFTIVTTYDLTNATDREAFESLRGDDEALADARSRFADRMDAIAAAVSDRVDREVVARDARVSLETVEDTGVVRLSVAMTNLAAADEGRLVLTEPFASGFTADRPVVVRPPEGYTVADATPAPSDQDDAVVTYAANTSLDGFELVYESDGVTDTGTPGFGLLAALAGLAGAVLLIWRRRE